MSDRESGGRESIGQDAVDPELVVQEPADRHAVDQESADRHAVDQEPADRHAVEQEHADRHAVEQEPAGRYAVDPRIRRTRVLLQEALSRLLETREFERISVQEIAEAATVNRATFYDHYPDKFALLECMVGTRFGELLDARGVVFAGGCARALWGIALGICDYLAALPKGECDGQRRIEPGRIEPHLEAAVIAVVRRMLMEGFVKHPPAEGVQAEMLAAALSWGMFGAAKEWVRTPERGSSEAAAGAVVRLVSPLFAGAMVAEAERLAAAR